MIATLHPLLKRSAIASMLITSSLFISNAYSIEVKVCELEAKAPLELSYCEILKAGHGGSLPNFYEFRRNPESTQRLLLRGSASKAGITLPGTSGKQARTTIITTPPPKAEQNPKQAPPPAAYRDALPRENVKQNTSIHQCQIQENRILCNTQQYFLAINVPVKRIKASVLSAQNRLLFRPQTAQETAIEYLSDMYPLYIEKMLLLGLGDSTLSFTKFHAIYEGAKDNNAFRERFTEMYELLKKERQSMAVKSRYLNNYPTNIGSCMPISAQLIACDNVAQNWIYRKVEMR